MIANDILRHRLREVLTFFDILDDLSPALQAVDLHDSESFQAFVSVLTDLAQRRCQQQRPLDMQCIVTLLCEFTAAWRVKLRTEGVVLEDETQSGEESLLQLVALLPFSQPSNRVICKLFDILRTSARIQQQEKVRQQMQQLRIARETNNDNGNNNNNTNINNNNNIASVNPFVSSSASSATSSSSVFSFSSSLAEFVSRWTEHADIPLIPLSLHPHVLSALRRCVAQDDPPHIFFPGDRGSSLQTSPVSMHAKKGFTIATWIKPLPPPAPSAVSAAAPPPAGAAGFTLFRGKNPNGDLLDLRCSPAVTSSGETLGGVWRIELRSRNDAIKGELRMSVGQWHLLTVCHTPGNASQSTHNEESGSVTICVDGAAQIESSLFYAKEEESQATIWTIGQGFCGCVASLAIYEQALSATASKFIHSLGPYLTNVKQGVYHAQSSYDTAHQPLGCLYAKGEWSKLCKVRCAFSLTPLLASLENVASYPLEKTGKVLPDYINLSSMSERSSTAESNVVIVNLSGKSTTRLRPSWMESFLEAGGVQLLLYLFWQYASLKLDEEGLEHLSLPKLSDEEKGNKEEDQGKEDDDDDSFVLMSEARENHELDAECVRDGLLQCIALLESVIHAHVEAKEHFLQLHGFHVLSACLSTWSKESLQKVVDAAFIDRVVQLVRALGPDLSAAADGAASALQGLLFDFRIWSALELDTLRYYLEKMSSICFDTPEALQKFVGIQRILDIFRINVSKLLTDDRDPNAISCADELQRLLILAKDAALQEAQKNAQLAAIAAANTPQGKDSSAPSSSSANANANAATGGASSSVPSGLISNETESILLCLEETNNCLIAERLCRVLENIRNTSPASLRVPMLANRYWDTVVVSLWTKRGFSLEVRQHALVNLVWLLSHELHAVPPVLMQLRKELFDAHNLSESAKSAGVSGIKLRSVLSQQAAVMKKCTARIVDLAKPSIYAWKNLLHLSCVLKNALRDGLWGAVDSSCLDRFLASLRKLHPELKVNDGQKEEEDGSDVLPRSDRVYEFDHLLIATMNEAQSESWLLLPLLPALSAYVTRETLERVLAQVNVQMKTEEALSEIVSLAEEASWMDALLDVLLVGIAHHHCSSTVPAPPAGPPVLNSSATASITSGSVTVYGTAAELAMDTLSSIIVHKLRLSVDELQSVQLWQSLWLSLQRMEEIFFRDLPAEHALFAESCFAKVLCLVLQRLIKLPEEQWAISLIYGCAPLLKMICDRQLCGDVSHINLAPTQPRESGDSDDFLVDIDSESMEVTPSPSDALTAHTQSENEVVRQTQTQLFRLVLELAFAVRHYSLTHPCDGNEWRVLKRAFRVLLSRMSPAYINEENAPSLAREIEQHIQLVTLTLNEKARATFSRRGSIHGGNSSSQHGRAITVSLPYNPAEFKKLVVDTIFALFDCVNHWPTSSAPRRVFKQTIEKLLVFFREESVKALTENLPVSAAVQEVAMTLGKHAGSPLDLVYKVLCAEWKEEVISFLPDAETEKERDNDPLSISVSGPPSIATNATGSASVSLPFSATNTPARDELLREEDDDFETVDRPVTTAGVSARTIVSTVVREEKESLSSSVTTTNDLLDLAALDLLDLGFAGATDSLPTTETELVNAFSPVNDGDLSTPSVIMEEALVDLSLSPSPVPVSLTHPQAQTGVESKEANTASVDEKIVREDKFQHWLRIRTGISSDRIDTERARMTHSMSLQDLSLDATRKFWRRERRKIESELFLQAHRCHWKLAIAHEGPFYGRKRVILRPRFENLYTTRTFECAMQETLNELEARERDSERESERAAEELLERALVNECSGYIRDVTRSEGELLPESTAANTGSAGSGSASDALSNGDADVKQQSERGRESAPGTGWGIVDADDSEEGFGVVGLANANASPTPTLSISAAAPSPASASIAETPTPAEKEIPRETVTASTKASNVSASVKEKTSSSAANSSSTIAAKKSDPLGELHLLEEKHKYRRRVYDTAPCAPGASKCDDITQVRMENRVVLVTASGNGYGWLSFTADELCFRSSVENEELREQDNAAVNLGKELKMRRRRWRIDAISAIYLRRYRLRDSALEIFFRKGKHRNIFVDFGHTKEDAKTRTEFARALTAVAPSSAFKQTPAMSPLKMVIDHGVQDKWLEGKISNFDYLMALNTIAGRSYNDLCQYPVMPWVLSDYSSASIDLQNPRVYRDLSKPMGALNENRLKDFLDRFHSFEENVSTGIPAFMYGSHYSTMVGVVLHFLVRLQPFAALHQEMQNGHFDVPDRLFSSVPRSFLHNTTQLSEVKEITPEWFTTPEMFRNVNRFDFGSTQDGDRVDDVELPPWANNSPEEFVRINRAALESDFVSEHLHEWIDLIFGYKQRGPESIAANNVFYYLTYYGAVDHYMIQDEAVRRATELQIAHFGQVPLQLFKTPHPAKKVRNSSNNNPLPLTRSLARSIVDMKHYHKTSRDAQKEREKEKECQRGREASSSLLLLSTNEEPFSVSLPSPDGNTNTQTSESSQSSQSALSQFCDEEQLVYESPATLIVRKTERVVVHMVVLVDRVLCVLDNGVLEVLKYAASEEARNALATAQTVRAAAQTMNANNPNIANANTTGSSAQAHARRSTLAASPSVEDLLFGDPFDSTPTGTGSAVSSAQQSRHSRSRSMSTTSATTTTSSSSWIIVPALQSGESLFAVDKEYAHFEVVPKMPLPPRPPHAPLPLAAPLSMSNVTTAAHERVTPSVVTELGFAERQLRVPAGSLVAAQSFAEIQAGLLAFDRASKLCLSCGRLDGVVSVREIDTRSGVIKSGGDFSAHRRRVVAVSCDTNNADFDVVASLDEAGQLFVWTILHPKPSELERSCFTMERRPQKAFRVDPCADMHLSLSTHMNIVVAVSGPLVYVFSIERNELLFSFKLRAHVESESETREGGETAEEDRKLSSWNRAHHIVGSAFNGPLDHVFGHQKHLLYTHQGLPEREDTRKKVDITRRVALSDFGYLVAHVESFVHEESVLEFEDHLVSAHALVSYSLSGQQTAVVQSLSAVSALVCPDRAEVVIAGHRDGSVLFYQVQNLHMLYRLEPSSYCVQYNLALPGANKSSSSSSAGNAANRTSTKGTSSSQFDAGKKTGDSSAIIAIAVGPNRFAPAVLCLSTEAGNIYIHALPDFIRWEKNRSPSAFAQLASVPLQAVKGTLMQAAETAGVFAQNAKSFADDALTEFKKIRRNSLVKGISSLFGVKSPKDDDA